MASRFRSKRRLVAGERGGGICCLDDAPGTGEGGGFGRRCNRGAVPSVEGLDLTFPLICCVASSDSSNRKGVEEKQAPSATSFFGWTRGRDAGKAWKRNGVAGEES